MTESQFDIGNIPPQLRESMLHGKGAEDIKWGSGGDFNRCRAFLAEHGVPKKFWDGECAELHKEATGFWPGRGREHSGDEVEEFAAQVHTGAMVALIPSAADTQRLCLDGGEPAAEMHLTLAYLGDAAQWSDTERLELAATVARAVGQMGPVEGEAFSLAYFNPHDTQTDTALVYGIGGAAVERIHANVYQALDGLSKVPDQHRPFAAHVTAAYTDDLAVHEKLVDRLGPMTFDTVRLAFGGEHYNISLDHSGGAVAAAMGDYSPVTWFGPLAPIGSPTGDRRIFPPDTLKYQTFPAPLRWQERGLPGHEGATVVGRILHAAEGEWDGKPYIMANGDWFNPDIFPDAGKAMILVDGGVSGPSVDLDTFTGTSVTYQGKQMLVVTEGRVRGATLVSIPAFADLRLQLQYPPEPASMDGSEVTSSDMVGDLVTPEADTSDPLGDAMVASIQEFASVNGSGWKGAPIAPRDAVFDADDAVSRIEAYAGIGSETPDQAKMSKMFLWINPDGNALGRDGYKLPWGDIFDGKPHLVYHAIYAAAALLEGGHGGLPNIPDSDKARLRSVISEIYAKLATEFGDPNIQASWDRAAEKADNAPKASLMETEAGLVETQTFAVQGGFGDMPIAAGDPTWDKGAALRELDSWAGDDIGKYKRAFLYREDGADPKLKGSYKFPVARPINGKLTIIPAAVRNAAARVANANVSDKDALRSAIETLMGRVHRMESALTETGLIASGFDGIHPPREAFSQKKLPRKTKWTVVPRDGYNEVYGHLADWDTCHMGLQIGRPDVCVKPPRSKRGYKDFHINTILTAEGDLVEVGKFTIDTYHGSTGRGLTAAQVRAHYEHTGTEAAVGRVYEDEFGPAFFGVQVPDTSPALAQKMRRTPASGHWHPVEGHLELVAALGVNRPAYPITAAATGEVYMDESSSETVVMVEDGEQTGLIAGVTFTAEELAAQEQDCGCTGEDSVREQRIARLAGLPQLPTHEEIRARAERLAKL